MKSLLGILAIVALALGVAACSSSKGSAPRPDATGTHNVSKAIPPNYSTHNNDRDNDGDHNNDDENVLAYGHAAGAIDRRSSVALVTRYFAAAAAEDGATGCRLLTPIIAGTVAETDGHSPGLRGKTCAVVLSKLFKLHHRLLAEKNATLKIIKVRVLGDKALAVLEFPTIPEVRLIAERRVAGTWKLLYLLDGILE